MRTRPSVTSRANAENTARSVSTYTASWQRCDTRKGLLKMRDKKTSVKQGKVQRLVRCRKCGSLLPTKPCENGNGFEQTPIAHTHWSNNKLRGIEETWCPGGGI